MEHETSMRLAELLHALALEVGGRVAARVSGNRSVVSDTESEHLLAGTVSWWPQGGSVEAGAGTLVASFEELAGGGLRVRLDGEAPYRLVAAALRLMT
jgi:hypothetical protein